MAKFEPKDEDIGASDYRAYFDSSCLRVWHLNGKERTYRIKHVSRLTSEMVSGKAREVKKQPKLELEDAQGRPVPLPFLLNKTNAKAIAQLYGNNPKQWEGKLITLFTVTGVDTPQGPSDAIRIRNQVPKASAKGRAVSDDVAYQARDNERATHEEIGKPLLESGVDEEEPPHGALETDNVAH